MMDMKTLRPDKKMRTPEPMAAVDHAWLRMDSPVNPMVISGVMTFKTSVDHPAFIRRMTDKFAAIPRFVYQSAFLVLR